MSIPLDRLYNYLDDCVNHELLIYGWKTHGSRNLDDIVPWSDYTYDQFLSYAPLVCHDQEPLDFKIWTKKDFLNRAKKICELWHPKNWLQDKVLAYMVQQHLRGVTQVANRYDLTMLLHSELNSQEVNQFDKHGFVPVYYWSHGLIAFDWFRYAQHDPLLQFNRHEIQHNFLIYNRAWAGTREYRLCLAEQIVEQNLVEHCKMSFAASDQGHYSEHFFSNPDFKITNYKLDQYFPKNIYTANASADYCSQDYASTGIEIVLETLFDDTRWHLTEKALRPIACGQPFILMATPGSLQYLRNYGFQTFSDLIDETYDEIANPKQRLQKVITEMLRISRLPTSVRHDLFWALRGIAAKNKLHFFTEFPHIVKKEYANNMQHALSIMNQHKTGKHSKAILKLLQD